MKKSLFGYGLTTGAIAEHCQKDGCWEIYDDKFEISSGAPKLDEFGNALLNPSEFDPAASELEIPSPGFPPHHELVRKARNLISEYDYFDDYKGLKIWISGTNGKTTTTKMMQHLLERYGSQMGGNVGVPLAKLDKSAKIWVLETSSFTLHYTKHARPDIYVLLAITPDHLSWHGDFAEYERAKLSPLPAMREGSVALIPRAYENSAAAQNSLARVICYEDEVDLAQKFGIDLGEIKFLTPFLIDALLALCVEKILFDRCDAMRLNDFVIEGNKLEEFTDARGRLWVNDTKATNIDACAQALKRYAGRKIHLILGGDDKGVDLHPLFAEFKKYDLQIYAIGSNTDKIVLLCDGYKLPCVRCEILQTAVGEISKRYRDADFKKSGASELKVQNLSANGGCNGGKAKENAKIGENTLQKGGGSSAASDNASSPKKRRTNDGGTRNSQNSKNFENFKNSINSASEIALLSPACASLDQFKSYAERGELFKKQVAQLG
ncbi:UDP-N-acetylmuramoyl-L-alanine--D-glutamate ligase [uncultured Campylobacter sp.]|uniref:UDP-N-acetylmuramoyl-L-alanine--D-glutamate ligase n=1 Tax=uncultured Campylobacter sp. TaxID=218934 RepID=UPI002601AD0B|nr:UDP-N-acetylmuramoyl-L-alanine--D-glutamate ligase [uncultured Campylobacter sp.]